MHRDASKIGIGLILSQKKSDKLQPLAYYSRKTTPEEQRFHSMIYMNSKLLRWYQHYKNFEVIYLLGINFKAVTDFNEIRSTMTKRDLIPGGEVVDLYARV